MVGLFISLLIQAISLVVRLVAFVVLLAVRLVMGLIAGLARGGLVLIAAATALAFRGWSGLAAAWRHGRGMRGSGSLRQPIDPELRWAVFRRDGYACLFCGSESNLSVDHVFPVSRGGGNEPDNLQTLCRNCNSRKGALV